MYDCFGVLNMVRSNMDVVLINICIFERHKYKNHTGVNSQTNPLGGGSLPSAYQSEVWLGAQKSLVYSRPPEAVQVAVMNPEQTRGALMCTGLGT